MIVDVRQNVDGVFLDRPQIGARHLPHHAPGGPDMCAVAEGRPSPLPEGRKIFVSDDGMKAREVDVEVLKIGFRQPAVALEAQNVLLDAAEDGKIRLPRRLVDVGKVALLLPPLHAEDDVRKAVVGDGDAQKPRLFCRQRVFKGGRLAVRIFGMRMIIKRELHGISRSARFQSRRTSCCALLRASHLLGTRLPSRIFLKGAFQGSRRTSSRSTIPVSFSTRSFTRAMSAETSEAVPPSFRIKLA